jgi:hypothetical protein
MAREIEDMAKRMGGWLGRSRIWPRRSLDTLGGIAGKRARSDALDEIIREHGRQRILCRILQSSQMRREDDGGA